MIIELLPRGKEKAISTIDLCRMAGIDSVRTLRKEVAKERKEGNIIASCNSGYYIPTDVKEIAEFVHTLDSKARSIMVALQSARKVLKGMVDENQMTLDSNIFTQIWLDEGVLEVDPETSGLS